MKKQLLTAVFAIITITAIAQNAVFPDNGTLYDGKLHKVELIMHPDTLTALLASENRWTNQSYPATFVYDNKDTLTEVGVRMKGNTSRGSRKLSFKIDVDEFKNQNYQGLKTFNLNGNHNDPSMCREVLSANVMHASGNVSLRTNSIQLYFNGVLRGTYTHAEHINKKFLESRFGENSGNLYKCSWPAELNWLGSEQQVYKDLINPSPLNERAYELKTNENADDYSDLVNLINVINNTAQVDFKEAIDTIFDVPAYLKVLATEVLIGHWDNYFYNKNNYYLYHHQATGKFVYIPYDMDNTFGVQWGVSNIDQRDIYAWGNEQNTKAPLTNKILKVPEYKVFYETCLRELCDSAFGESRLFTLMDSLRIMLIPAIVADTFFNGSDYSDYGYSFTDWEQSFTQAIDDHATFGLKPYVSGRRNSALQQLPPATGLYKAGRMQVLIYPNPASNILTVEYTGPAKIHLSIVSFSGQIVAEKELSSGDHYLSIEELPVGIYILNLHNGYTFMYQKLVIE